MEPWINMMKTVHKEGHILPEQTIFSLLEWSEGWGTLNISGSLQKKVKFSPNLNN